MKKVLCVLGEDNEYRGENPEEWLQPGRKFEPEFTNDPNALEHLPGGDFAGVVLFPGSMRNGLSPAQRNGVSVFVKSGGGLVAIGSAVEALGSGGLEGLINAKHAGVSSECDVAVSITEKDHYVTIRAPGFTVRDRMMRVENVEPGGSTVLAHACWQGKRWPMAFAGAHEKGRTVCLVNGFAAEARRHPEFRKLATRSVEWSVGAELSEKTISCGLLGYGPAFQMGRSHGGWIDGTPGLKTVAMCDTDPARVEAARREIPDLKGYFTSLDDMLAMPGLDLVVNILPHNLHASTALKCMEAGKHVVLEKPFSVTIEEANAMVRQAARKKVMLSLFHNRRWDEDYLAIRDLVDRGLIGDIFHMECGFGGYGRPGNWWRSDKAVSGGVMHDWGAHFIDWILNLVPSEITQVMGDFQKRMWHAVTNEDHGQAYIRFGNGVTADFWISSMAALGRPAWLILGTLGAIAKHGGEELTLVSYASGVRLESKVKHAPVTCSGVQYYRNVADHLLMGEDLSVTPEQARRVIAVIDAAQRSSAIGRSVAPEPGCG